MAIAYFIPDQAQLLARSSNSQQSTQQSSTSANTSHSRQQTGGTRSPTQQQRQPQAQAETQSSHFRANFSVPLSQQQGTMSSSGGEQQDLGCWELLAQIFCYALRLYSYNSTQHRTRSINIQISLEISSTSCTEADATDASSAASKPN